MRWVECDFLVDNDFFCVENEDFSGKNDDFQVEKCDFPVEKCVFSSMRKYDFLHIAILRKTITFL